ncbi:unnamed protein product [Brassicogethes aeneus]|uniref:Uncharacterized protein n=1 Tax=Brassicogethes aeneus TaxID=1431903 RepID=A0A9P0BHE5_BRAAE|nr:unnamed protein product [Brassicogethes aeneus]
MKIMTPSVISALDRTKTTDRNAWHIFVAVASAIGLNINQIPSHSTIRRHRIEGRERIAKDLKEDLQTARSLVVHWDGKMLPDIVGNKKVDRLPILISGFNTRQILGVPKLKESTGVSQALIIAETLNEWNVTDRVKPMCLNKPTVNTANTMSDKNPPIKLVDFDDSDSSSSNNEKFQAKNNTQETKQILELEKRMHSDNSHFSGHAGSSKGSDFDFYSDINNSEIDLVGEGGLRKKRKPNNTNMERLGMAENDFFIKKLLRYLDFSNTQGVS